MEFEFDDFSDFCKDALYEKHDDKLTYIFENYHKHLDIKNSNMSFIKKFITYCIDENKITLFMNCIKNIKQINNCIFYALNESTYKNNIDFFKNVANKFKIDFMMENEQIFKNAVVYKKFNFIDFLMIEKDYKITADMKIFLNYIDLKEKKEVKSYIENLIEKIELEKKLRIKMSTLNDVKSHHTKI